MQGGNLSRSAMEVEMEGGGEGEGGEREGEREGEGEGEGEGEIGRETGKAQASQRATLQTSLLAGSNKENEGLSGDGGAGLVRASRDTAAAIPCALTPASMPLASSSGGGSSTDTPRSGASGRAPASQTCQGRSRAPSSTSSSSSPACNEPICIEDDDDAPRRPDALGRVKGCGAHVHGGGRQKGKAGGQLGGKLGARHGGKVRPGIDTAVWRREGAFSKKRCLEHGGDTPLNVRVGRAAETEAVDTDSDDDFKAEKPRRVQAPVAAAGNPNKRGKASKQA